MICWFRVTTGSFASSHGSESDKASKTLASVIKASLTCWNCIYTKIFLSFFSFQEKIVMSSLGSKWDIYRDGTPGVRYDLSRRGCQLVWSTSNFCSGCNASIHQIQGLIYAWIKTILIDIHYMILMLSWPTCSQMGRVFYRHSRTKISEEFLCQLLSSPCYKEY